MHSAYNDVLTALTYSIRNFVNIVMGGLYNLFQIVLLETDSNGNVIGFNFLGTCIILILALYIMVYAIIYLVTLFAFGQSKDDMPKFSDIENMDYWENTALNSANNSGYYSYNYENTKNPFKKIYYKRLTNYNNKRTEKAIKQYEIAEQKAMKKWENDIKLSKFRRYRNYRKK